MVTNGSSVDSLLGLGVGLGLGNRVEALLFLLLALFRLQFQGSLGKVLLEEGFLFRYSYSHHHVHSLVPLSTLNLLPLLELPSLLVVAPHLLRGDRKALHHHSVSFPLRELPLGYVLVNKHLPSSRLALLPSLFIDFLRPVQVLHCLKIARMVEICFLHSIFKALQVVQAGLVSRPERCWVGIIVANAKTFHVALKGGNVGFYVVLMNEPIVLLDGVSLSSHGKLILEEVLLPLDPLVLVDLPRLSPLLDPFIHEGSSVPCPCQLSGNPDLDSLFFFHVPNLLSEQLLPLVQPLYVMKPTQIDGFV
mmetsp:Transcript_13556/g.27693  ORF Transcript_13556/g.27693 Transcript_13556/m.27693 type:complete len:306 (-) Transcript_13556:491-1408(-)